MKHPAHSHLLAPDDAQPSIEEAAQAFAAIGSEPRLQALRLLVRAGPDGLGVGEVQQALGLAASTCTHHLRFLAAAGLVEQTKTGRNIACRANFARIEALAEYLMTECCVDAGKPRQTPPEALPGASDEQPAEIVSETRR